MVKSEDTTSPKKRIAITLSDSEDDDDDCILLDTTPVFSKKKKNAADSVTSSLRLIQIAAKEEEPCTVESKPKALSAKPEAVTSKTSTVNDKVSKENKPKANGVAKVCTALGSFNSHIAGASHYRGRVSPHQELKLVRNQSNSHDRNAIQLVCSNGDVRGHIPRETAAILAPLLDRGGFAFAAHVKPNLDSITVTIFAESFHTLSKTEVTTETKQVDIVLRNLVWKPYVSVVRPQPKPIAATSVVPHENSYQYEDMEVSTDEMEIATPPLAFSDFLEPTVDTSEVSNGAIDEEKLDRIFEILQQEQLKNLPDIAMPKQLADMHLYDFQINGIKWLYRQETEGKISPFFEQKGPRWFCKISQVYMTRAPQQIRGAVLADDMGLGKTLQTLGLILLNPPRGQNGYPYVRCANSCSLGPRTTLIVAPLSVMANWQIQIEKHINKRKNKKVFVVAKYHGQQRQSQLTRVQFNQVDILITSYNTLAWDLKKYNLRKEKKGVKSNTNMREKRSELSIFDLTFHRVVLDEAHMIRNSKTGFFKVAKQLQTNHKLCLTGTIFVNRPDDIHSILSFLGVEPLCAKRAFEKAITERIKRRDHVGLSTLRTSLAVIALRRTKPQVLSTIKLVTKEVIDRTVEFPSGEHKKIHDVLYNATRSIFLTFLRSSGKEGITENYMMFLELVLRVRQGLIPASCIENANDCLNLVRKKYDSSKDGIDPEEANRLLDLMRGIELEEDADAPKNECKVCYEVLQDESVSILRECKHVFCEPCLQKITNQVCPLCRNPYSPDDIVTKAQIEAATEKGKAVPSDKKSLKGRKKIVKNASSIGRSPKVQALFDEIEKMKPDEKGVIFSQWTSYLDILENEFIDEGYTYTRLDGTMSSDQRLENMEAFDTEGCDSQSTPRFILCSLMACGTGINLTRGNVVFLMDPWWNAAVASQAMDRVHRIGQSRPVRVIRLIMKDSIEIRMMALQEAKSALGKGSMQKLRQEEKRKVRILSLEWRKLNHWHTGPTDDAPSIAGS